MSDKRLEKPVYIQITIRYQSMIDALEEAKAKTGIRQNATLAKQLIWNKAKGLP